MAPRPRPSRADRPEPRGSRPPRGRDARATTPPRGDRRPDRRPAPARTPATHRIEVTYLPGLADVVAAEITEVLAPARPPVPVPGRDDTLTFAHRGPLDDPRLLALRTAVAVFAVLTFDVPRPKSLTSGEHLPRIAAALDASARLGARRTFRFEAAGRESSVFQRLAALLSEASRMDHRADDGEILVRFRRTPGARAGGTSGASGTGGAGGDAGWDVLVRLGGPPLSARAWRVADYPGAVNATIAAAIVRLAGVRARDRVVNLMCGSGTLLVERLLAGPAAVALGVDVSAEAVAATRENVAAAGLTDQVRLDVADVLAPGGTWRDAGPFDLVLVDPPWGTTHGSHATSAAVHAQLLEAAHAVCAPGGRLVVLTHEITVMERCLRVASGLWQERAAVRVFAKGHHPRIYLLDRR
ncbi:methyltransferase [Cellulomonas sp. NS3]|uniref:methyltransferase n=1 Tax=Cellulomonas sp. NS3 TaxID=2973977 RepID=UPI002162991B|nr:methyltransferase [Cellulomonas sp. NS3]